MDSAARAELQAKIAAAADRLGLGGDGIEPDGAAALAAALAGGVRPGLTTLSVGDNRLGDAGAAALAAGACPG
eukprot:SAG22_NODE_2338_length_2691_cov_3.150463_2_plen_73_part_00